MRIQKGRTSDIILTILEKSVDLAVRLEDFTSNLNQYGKFGPRDLPKSTLSQAISRLKNQGLIEQVVDESGIILKLTEAGKLQINTKQDKEPAWDGKWRVVVFDIPEKQRVVRNHFRANLKKSGFKKYQRSVWISQRDTYDSLSNLISELKMSQWVTIFETKKLSTNP